MMHDSSCGCPDCENFHPDRFDHVGAASPAPQPDYRNIKCPKCGRIRVENDGTCEKCHWNMDRGEYMPRYPEPDNNPFEKASPQPELGTCWLNEIGHGGKHEKSDRCSEWRAAPQPEPTPMTDKGRGLCHAEGHQGIGPHEIDWNFCLDWKPIRAEQPSPHAGARELNFFQTRIHEADGDWVPLKDAEAYAKKERERADAFRDTSSPPAGAREAHLFSSFHACENEGANCISFIQAIGGQKGHVCWCECHEWNKHA